MMKRVGSAKRVPRKIGSDDEIETTDTPTSSLRRPVIKSKRSSLQSYATDEESPDSGVITPKRSTLSRIALQRSAGQRSSFVASELPGTPDEIDDTPTYSASDLQALKDSTPSTPADTTLDVRDKFGTELAKYGQSGIPSALEIAEKKERRARLAQEAKADEYISLDPDNPGWEEDDDGNVLRDMDGRLVLKEKDKYAIQESRLVRDDEDVMEGFDEFTGETGSRIVMGASMLPADKQARRKDISAQIAVVDSDGSEPDLDEQRRNAAFEAAQTKHGTYAINTKNEDKYAEYRAKTPPNITALPDSDAVLRRLKATLLAMEEQKRAKEADMERFKLEKARIREEETRIQVQLKEVAEKFRQLKMDKGFLPKHEDEGTQQTTEGIITTHHDIFNERPLGAGLGF